MKDKKKQRKRSIYKRSLQTPASDFIGAIYDYGLDHKKLVLNLGYNTHFKLFEDHHEHLAKAIFALNKMQRTEDWGDHNVRQAMIFSKIPKSLFAAFKLLLDGDYDEANAVLRIAYESLLRILYIQKFPERADDVLVNKKGIFIASNVLTQDFPICQIDELYSVLSRPTHSYSSRLLKELIQGSQKGGIILDLGFRFDEDDFFRTLHLLLSVLYLSLRYFIGIFENKFVNFEAPIYKPLIEAMKIRKLNIHLTTASLVLKKLKSMKKINECTKVL